SRALQFVGPAWANSTQGKSSRWPFSHATRKRAGTAVGGLPSLVQLRGTERGRSPRCGASFSSKRPDWSGARRGADGDSRPRGGAGPRGRRRAAGSPNAPPPVDPAGPGGVSIFSPGLPTSFAPALSSRSSPPSPPYSAGQSSSPITMTDRFGSSTTEPTPNVN